MRVVAAMIRRCEGTDAEDQEEELVVEWAKAVKGWRGQAGNGKKLKKDAATMVKLLEEGGRERGYDQGKWYPDTVKALRAWAK